MLLKLLSLALYNLEIWSNDGIKLVSSFKPHAFSFRVLLPLLLDSRHAIESELCCVHGCGNVLPILFRDALFRTMWRHYPLCFHSSCSTKRRSHCPSARSPPRPSCASTGMMGPNRTSSLRTIGSFFIRKKKISPYGPYLPGTFHCEEVVRSRTLSQASRKGHRTSSHNGSTRSDTTLSLVISVLLPQGLEPTLILVFHAL